MTKCYIQKNAPAAANIPIGSKGNTANDSSLDCRNFESAVLPDNERGMAFPGAKHNPGPAKWHDACNRVLRKEKI
jgi:hypothetical protein